MARKIRIAFKNGIVEAELNDTKTAEAIYKALPISATANTWGEEIYFSIPVEAQDEPNVEEVEVGALAYWPPGRAFCVFFGRTPASTSDKPRAASKVTLIGHVVDDVEALKQVGSGESVKIEKI